MKMSLDDLYEIHDDFETLIRKMYRMTVVEQTVAEQRLMDKIWAAHDEIERMIVEAQALLPEEAIE